MRINEYRTLEEFTSQYTGQWSPSEGHWYGLEFRRGAKEYRLHTWQMYADDPAFMPDGQEALFALYAVNPNAAGKARFIRMASFASMEALLAYTGIDNKPFSEVIMDDHTEIIGQD